MRESIKLFVKICSKNLPISEPIYEFGSLQVHDQDGFADLRPFFPNKQYIGADIRNGSGVDVILNLHQVSLSSESVGTVLILDTLEHVEFPRKAVEESYRILKPNGILIMSSVMNFPIHNFPYDYWRFTPECFRSLLKPFNLSVVESVGTQTFPHTIIGIGFKGFIHKNFFTDIKRKLKLWKDFQYPVYRRFLKDYIPPIFLKKYQKFFKIKKDVKVYGKS